MYWWCSDIAIGKARELVGVAKNTITDWFNFFRDVCSEEMLSIDAEIGRAGRM